MRAREPKAERNGERGGRRRGGATEVGAGGGGAGGVHCMRSAPTREARV
jgi:hypothetical protein